MVILNLRPYDLQHVERLNAALFPGIPVPKAAETFWWLALEGKSKVGFGGYRLIEGGDTAFLNRAGVLPFFRGRGIQRRLIRTRLSHAKRSGARVAITYTTADNVWSANNLIRTGFVMYRPQQYWAGNEMVYWWKDLL